MTRDKTSQGKTVSDSVFVKRKLKQIKEAKKNGNDVAAQRLADELFLFLGWD